MSYRVILLKLLPKRFESDFLDGNLYLNTSAFFGTIDNNDIARFDPHDGASECIQNAKVEVRNNKGDWLPLPVIGPITTSSASSTKLNLLCMYTITDRPEDSFDSRNLDFGDVAIIIDNLSEFIQRIEQAALAAGKQVQRGPIQYVDRLTYDGTLGPFRKYIQYGYQNEFRFVFTNGPGTCTRLSIGDIRDIAHSISATDVPFFWRSMLKLLAEPEN